MRVGLIDVDSHNFPNLPLMKLSAWHKAHGDSVEWYEPLFGGHYDRVYMSKVFSFSPDYLYPINADEVIRGGSGFCIRTENGVESFDASQDTRLPEEVEHICPDYGLYGVTETAYGFMSRGCPRGCSFCHVAAKEGRKSYKVADLDEFWKGQERIEILDPNLLACPEWKDLLQQAAASRAEVNFNQGMDIRLMTEEKAEILAGIRMKYITFAWDRYEDKDVIIPKLKLFREASKVPSHNAIVYVLCNFDSTIAMDLERIYTIRDLGFSPYVMLYDKTNIPKGSELIKIQRWVNNRFVFWSVPTYEEYKKK